MMQTAFGISTRAVRENGSDARAYLGRLGGTDHAPLRVVQLPRPRQFAVATDRRVETTQMRQRRRERQSIQHLRMRRHSSVAN